MSMDIIKINGFIKTTAHQNMPQYTYEWAVMVGKVEATLAEEMVAEVTRNMIESDSGPATATRQTRGASLL